MFVHLVAEAHRVDHGEAEPDVALIEVIGLSPQLHLRLKVGRLKVFKIGVEQSVHQSRLANAGFTWRQKQKKIIIHSGQDSLTLPYPSALCLQPLGLILN